MLSSATVQALKSTSAPSQGFLKLTPALRKRVYNFLPFKKLEFIWDKWENRPSLAYCNGKVDLATIRALAQTCRTINYEVCVLLGEHVSLTLHLDVHGSTMEEQERFFIGNVAASLQTNFSHLRTLRMSLDIEPSTDGVVPLAELSYLSKALQHTSALESITIIFRLIAEDCPGRIGVPYHVSSDMPADGASQRANFAPLRAILDSTNAHAPKALEDAWDEEPMNTAKILFWKTVEKTIDQDDPEFDDEVALRATCGLRDILDSDGESDDDDDGSEDGHWETRDGSEQEENDEESIVHAGEEDELLSREESFDWCCFQ